MLKIGHHLFTITIETGTGIDIYRNSRDKTLLPRTNYPKSPLIFKGVKNEPCLSIYIKF
jgi:hypothetical protein